MEKKSHAIIASVVLSILVWLSVSMNNQYSVTVRIPFKVSDIPAGLSLANPIPRHVSVRIRGTGWQVASSYLSTTASVNFDASALTRKRVILTSRDLSYSMDIGSAAQVLNIDPDSVMVSLDSTITRKVPIFARVDVQPREGFMVVGAPRVTPDSVTITGARRLLREIETWETQPREFKRVINTISATIPLSDTLPGIVQVAAREARVRVDVEQVADNTYHDVPIRIEGNADSANVLLLPPAVDITVRGGINEMANVTVDSFKVTVNYRRIHRSGNVFFRPTVEAPAQLQVISLTPDSIECIIRK